MRYEGLIAETVSLRGWNGDEIETYYARPLGPGPFPGVVVIHHAPGWDEWCHEVARKFAHHGYAAILPHLYYRVGEGDPDDLAAKARADGGVADDLVIGDVRACTEFLREQPYANGKIGVIGFCSGGRHTYLVACNLPGIDAAVDCWGGRVIVDDATQLNEKRPVPVIDMTANLTAPLLGIFGNDDQSPSPEEVNRTEEKLKSLGKTYVFHRYDGAGHGFFNTAGAGYRQAQAVDGWKQVFAFYGQHLQARTPVAAGAR
jgi:carboxymethylenebutenolidase